MSDLAYDTIQRHEAVESAAYKARTLLEGGLAPLALDCLNQAIAESERHKEESHKAAFPDDGEG